MKAQKRSAGFVPSVATVLRVAFALFVLGNAITLADCKKKDGVQFYSEDFPSKLSEWKLFTQGEGGIKIRPELIPYDLNTPLFSDYALKFRTVYVPSGETAKYTQTGVLDFPVGTIFTKTFYYPRKPGMKETTEFPSTQDFLILETRLLVHTSRGWIGLPYIWNKEGTEAILEITGGEIPVESFSFTKTPVSFTYSVPNQAQCQGCHITKINDEKVMVPIGPKARQLNREYAYPSGKANQLAHWTQEKILSGLPAHDPAPILKNIPANVDYTDTASSLEERSRAYLDSNCGHCHNALGPANTSGVLLNLEETDTHKIGVCKTPTAAGKASANLEYDIVPGRPDRSILIHRMTSTEAGIRMPELARSLLHKEGLDLVRAWVQSMKGNCN
ncbi:MAG: hypothetical protein JNM27_14770 [Leptospirales bacterium]|nr:hypothetical protein [Leptospirales bacterium]